MKKIQHFLVIIFITILIFIENCFAIPIIGGDVVEDRTAFKYQVLLRIKTKSLTLVTCGGSIIDENHVLTAGHCVADTTSAGVTVRAGIIERSNEGDDYSVYSIHKYEFYKNQRGKPIQYDIAVLKINGPIIFGDYVGEISMAMFPVPIGTECTYTGWGSAVEARNAPSSQILRKARGKIRHRQFCISHGIPVQSYEQCFSRISEQESAIMNYGDSGSGFVCNGVLTGVLVRGNSKVAEPAVYIEVRPFSIFINHIRADYPCGPIATEEVPPAT